MIDKISINEIKEVISMNKDICQTIKDEMAIPSYLHSNPLIRWLMWRRYECIADFMGDRKYLAVLEFGCGTGIFLPTLCKKASKVFAIDLFSQFAKILAQKRNLNVNFVESLDDIENNTLDVIIAADVMEHLEKPTEYINKLYKKLKVGGKFIVSGPTETIIYKIGRFMAGFGDKGDYHYTNIDNLKKVINDNGFVVKKLARLPFKTPPCLFKIFEFEKK